MSRIENDIDQEDMDREAGILLRMDFGRRQREPFFHMTVCDCCRTARLGYTETGKYRQASCSHRPEACRRTQKNPRRRPRPGRKYTVERILFRGWKVARMLFGTFPFIRPLTIVYRKAAVENKIGKVERKRRFVCRFILFPFRLLPSAQKNPAPFWGAEVFFDWGAPTSKNQHGRCVLQSGEPIRRL